MLVELQKHKTERKSAPFDVRGFISAGRSASARRNLHFLSVVSFETLFFYYSTSNLYVHPLFKREGLQLPLHTGTRWRR